MANDAAGTSWDESSPSLSDARRLGQQEIRGLRTGVRLRTEREHGTFAGSSVGGEHKEGSAKGYYEGSPPTLRPDGSTPLDADDAGRVWVHSATKVVKVWDGSAWQNVTLGGGSAAFVLGALTPVSINPYWTNSTGKIVFLIISGSTSGIKLTLDGVDVGFTFRDNQNVLRLIISIFVPAGSTVTLMIGSVPQGLVNGHYQTLEVS